MQTSAATADPPRPPRDTATAWVLWLPLAPTLVAFNLPPSPTLLNQCLALGLWGACICAMSSGTPVLRARSTWMLLAACAAVALSAAVTIVSGHLPAAIGVSAVVLLTAGALIAALGSALPQRREAGPVFSGFLFGLTVAGALSALIGFIQVFTPDLADGDWIARSALPGRAVGNLRQPNHLSSLLLWSVIAAVALIELRRIPARSGVALVVVLLTAVALTGSRTGLLGTGLLAAWAVLDRRLERGTRGLLLLAPLLAGVAWAGLLAWGSGGGHVFGGEGRLALGSGGDLSSSRFAIWLNALRMIAAEPLTGVGYGEFNLAWTLSAFPDRPVAFFDHTHNLPLQLLVEMGVPAGSVTLALLLAAGVQAWRRAARAEGDLGTLRRAAAVLVLMIGLHSLLEYPLWYAYFLLPTAFAWGFALSVAGPAQGPAPRPPSLRAPLFALGMAIIIGATAAVLDYHRIVVIYEPPENAAPLEDRIALGQRSPLFGHHADYAAATAFGPPQAPLTASQKLAFERAPHHLLDIRLMIAWSQALAAEGEVDKARWLAARIREFRNPGADEYFEPCDKPAEAALAFQCQAPQRRYHWREFVTR